MRDCLAEQNVPLASMTSQGFGKTQPVASNETAGGRQENRHVDMILSSDVMGTRVRGLMAELAFEPATLKHLPGS